MQGAGLDISMKTTVVASTTRLAEDIATGLRKNGVPATAKVRFTDLGVDCNAARARNRLRGGQRMQSGARRAGAIM
eukprot:5724476-Pyramimonas_sp.AAC.1